MDLKTTIINELENICKILRQDNINENNEDRFFERHAINNLLNDIIEDISTSNNQEYIIKVIIKLKKDMYEYFTEWWTNNEIAAKNMNNLQLYILKFKRSNTNTN